MSRRRRQSREKGATVIVSFAWYDAAQWAKLKLVAYDASNLNDTYDEWLREAIKIERELIQQGVTIKRVSIDVESLTAWCESRKKPNTGESRSAYAAELAAGIAS